MDDVFHRFGRPDGEQDTGGHARLTGMIPGWNEALQKHRPDRGILQQIAAGAMPCRACAFACAVSESNRRAGRTRESERSDANIRQLGPAVPDRGEIGRQWRHLAHVEAALDRIVKVRGA